MSTDAPAAEPGAGRSAPTAGAEPSARLAATAADPPAPLRIGLTGGIGSGKSTVARFLADLGATIVDTDRIARELTLPGGAAIDAVRDAFGPEAIDADGAMDRARMRERVFADAAVKRRLEAILHPLIGLETERQAARAGPVPAIVFDVPLLVESGKRWRSVVDRILVVDCSIETQIARVAARPGWTAETAAAVVAQQAGRAERRAAADAVIENDGLSLEALREAVQALWMRWAG